MSVFIAVFIYSRQDKCQGEMDKENLVCVHVYALIHTHTYTPPPMNELEIPYTK